MSTNLLNVENAEGHNGFGESVSGLQVSRYLLENYAADKEFFV